MHNTTDPAESMQTLSQSDMGGGKYVYCIIRGERPSDFGTIGIGEGSNRVHTVHYQGLAAVGITAPVSRPRELGTAAEGDLDRYIRENAELKRRLEELTTRDTL